MKNKKIPVGLAIGLICLAVLLILLLTMCGGNQDEDPKQTEQTTITVETTAATEPEETVEETTEETTDVTEPSEEETEPTEETVPSGGPNNMGSFTGGSISSGTSDDAENAETRPAEVITVAQAGTEENPYAETVDARPMTLTTVKIPAEGEVSYCLFHGAGAILTIEDPDGYIVCNGVTYFAENGVATVELAADPEDAPVFLQVGTLAKTEKAYTLNITEPVGGKTNPDPLMFIENIDVTVGTGHPDGYFCTWTAGEDGTLTLSLDSITPENAQCDIILTLGDTTASLSQSADGMVSMVMEEGDEVSIQICVTSEEPQVKVNITGTFAPGFGTASNPYVVTLGELPDFFETVEIGSGKVKHYDVYRASGSILTIAQPDAWVSYNGETYTADESGIITVEIGYSDPRTPASLAIGNSAENGQVYTVSFAPAPGSVNNPLIVEDISALNVTVPEGCQEGYYIQWTAPNDGILSIEAAAVPETVEFDVILTNMNGYSMAWLSDGSPVTMNVTKDDVVMIQVAVSPDENWNYPEAEVTLSGTFTLIYGTANNPYTASLTELPGSIETVQIEAGTAVYYAISGVNGSILTIRDPDVYVVYNGVTYTANREGVLTLEVAASTSRNPITLQIGNTGEEMKSYVLSFEPTLGSVGNPETVYSLFTLTTTLKSGTADYYYSYTATANGAVSFWVDEEDSDDVSYDIILSSTGTNEVHALSESENSVVSMQVSEGDVVTIHVLTVSSSGSRKLAVKGAVFTGDGTAFDPYMTTVIDIPGGLASVEIANGAEVCYSVYRIGESILTIEDEDAYVIYDGKTYNAVDGVVTVAFAGIRPGYTTLFTVGNYLTDQEREAGQEADTEAYLMRLTTILGTYGNPQVLTDISSFTTDLEGGNESGYYYKWTAPKAGTVTFAVESIGTGEAKPLLTINRSSSAEQSVLEGNGTVSVDVVEGDSVTIIVSVMPDESYNYPAAKIVVSGAYAEEEMAESGTAVVEPEAEAESETAAVEPEAEAETESAAEIQPDEVETEPESEPVSKTDPVAEDPAEEEKAAENAEGAPMEEAPETEESPEE